MGGLSEAHAANGALQFGSGTHYVTFLQAPGLGVTTFTVEGWFYQETGGTTATTGAGGGCHSFDNQGAGRERRK